MVGRTVPNSNSHFKQRWAFNLDPLKKNRETKMISHTARPIVLTLKTWKWELSGGTRPREGNSFRK